MSEAAATSEAELLQTFLHERDVSCPRCEYNLRNLVGLRCPECGDQLVLRVNLAEPKLAAFLTGLIGLAAGAGLNGLLLLYVALLLVLERRGSLRLMDRFVIVNATGFVILGAAGGFWLRYRGSIRRQLAGRQWLLALTCWLLTIADLIIFTKMIR